MTKPEERTAPSVTERGTRDLLDRATPAQLRAPMSDILHGTAWFDSDPMGRA